MSAQQNGSAESFVNDDRTNLTVTEHAAAGASGEVPGTWLNPSEALTRFVPSETLEERNIRAMTPLRFGARLGDIGLLVPPGMLSEVVEDAKIYPLPTAPQWFQGLINLRGSLVPVFNLKCLFQMDAQDTETTNLLVLNSEEEAVGFLIDGLPVTLDARQRLEQVPLLPPVLREHAQAVFAQDGGIWVEVDFDGFFRTASSLPLA
jgi:twitching motility protein PilI